MMREVTMEWRQWIIYVVGNERKDPKAPSSLPSVISCLGTMMRVRFSWDDWVEVDGDDKLFNSMTRSQMMKTR